MNISIKNTAEFQTLNKYLNYGSNEIKKQRISLKTRINKMMSKNPQYKNVLYIINNNIDKNFNYIFDQVKKVSDMKYSEDFKNFVSLVQKHFKVRDDFVKSRKNLVTKFKNSIRILKKAKTTDEQKLECAKHINNVISKINQKTGYNAQLSPYVKTILDAQKTKEENLKKTQISNLDLNDLQQHARKQQSKLNPAQGKAFSSALGDVLSSIKGCSLEDALKKLDNLK